ncbi:MAG TPA: type II toxin-antitoxin system VapC family toxin [Actinocrinis sp.]|uniref:type II toxin-antitoxin system VapC family toxin n=1 Tax=Actinocrinis sp. TaxID=1920516 RepID=UPI002DDCC947|nr:type II toxin-antitoxin system VapC family toxin [Actinocrinis sp.]HEV2348164.1 type II toxin-antitoxin system VapC family toxin [Actinocrinis sp.]
MSAPAVLLDTDVASAEFKRKSLPILARVSSAYRPVICFVTFGEMTKWAELRSWAPHNRTRLNQWLTLMPTIHSSDSIARTWGELSAAAVQRGRPRPQNDMWIAAVCLTHGIPLATLNLKDFEDFESHHGLRIIRA